MGTSCKKDSVFFTAVVPVKHLMVFEHGLELRAVARGMHVTMTRRSQPNDSNLLSIHIHMCSEKLELVQKSYQETRRHADQLRHHP